MWKTIINFEAKHKKNYEKTDKIIFVIKPYE